MIMGQWEVFEWEVICWRLIVNLEGYGRYQVRVVWCTRSWRGFFLVWMRDGIYRPIRKEARLI